jgi:hypothetical protein
LWLTHGSRADLFRLCERRALRHAAFGTGAIAVVVASVSTMAGERLVAIGLPGALSAIVAGSGALCAAAYFGLMRVGAWSLPDVVLGGLIAAAAATPSVIVEGGAAGGPLLAGLLAAEIGLAVTCRAVAMRRWERIDWTRLRSSARWFTLPSPRTRYGK